MSEKKKVLFADYIRATATIGVVCIHAAALYFLQTFGSESWHFINALDGLCRYAVPLFFMISGMFHINNERYCWKDFFKKAIKLFFLYMLWQLVYVFVADKPFIIKSLIAPHYHLWFLPMIAVMYVLTPLFTRWVRKVKSITLYLIISFLIGSYALYSDLVIKNISVFSIIGCASYYIMGYLLNQKNLNQKFFLNQNKYKLNNYLAIFATIVCWAATVVGTWILSKGESLPSEVLYAYAMPNVMLGTMALFSLFSQVKTSFVDGIHKPLCSLSSLSFGVYLIHPIFIAFCYNIPVLESWPIIKCLITVVVSLSASWVLSWLISKVPYLSKIILK